MSKYPRKTIHLFGGGHFVDAATTIALKNNCNVVIRTSKRFLGSFDTKNQPRVGVFCGNNLLELMNKGGWPTSRDVGLSFSAPWILPKKVISAFELRIFNLHNQLLPLFRGAGGLTWNVLQQNQEWGVSIHHLTEEIDAGDIVAQKKIEKHLLNESTEGFSQHITNEGMSLIREWLDDYLKTGKLVVISKNKTVDSYYWPRLNTEIHGWIDWSWGLDDILLFCNAFSTPFSGAKTKCRSNTIRVWEAHRLDNKETFHPFQAGIVFRICEGELFVAHPDGAIRISRWSIDQEQKKIVPGDRLFTPRDLIEKAMETRVQYAPDGTLLFR